MRSVSTLHISSIPPPSLSLSALQALDSVGAEGPGSDVGVENSCLIYVTFGAGRSGALEQTECGSFQFPLIQHSLTPLQLQSQDQVFTERERIFGSV